jgi:hypothetical protein
MLRSAAAVDVCAREVLRKVIRLAKLEWTTCILLSRNVKGNSLTHGIEAGTCDNFWCFLTHVYDKDGALIILFLFIAYVFYKLVWKVWTSAMKSKDDEIKRLVEERNFYQEKVFPNRLSSDSAQTQDEE